MLSIDTKIIDHGTTAILAI